MWIEQFKPRDAAKTGTFGTLRTARSRRLKWLDYHNLLGIVALAWMTVVGATGVNSNFAHARYA